MIQRRTLLTAGVTAPFLSVARAQTPGVTATEIKFGQTFAYSGPASSYATHAKTQAALFKMINEQGGIAGRKLNFLSYDDGASPPRTVEQVRKLVEQDQVAFLFNTLATASNGAIVKYLNDRKVPHLFLYSGADKFCDPQTYPWSLGWLPSYRVEGQVYAKYARAQNPSAKIGVLFQNDDFGKDYLAGIRDVVGNSEAAVKAVSYEFTDASIDAQLLELYVSGIDVLISAASPKFAAMAIRKHADFPKKPLHIVSSVSTSVASVMTPAGLERSAGTVSSAFLKDPTDPTWANDAGLREWRTFMAKHYPDGDQKDVNNLLGYCMGLTLVKALQACGRDFSRENLLKQATSLSRLELPGLLPGITVNTTAQNYRPIQQLQMTRFDGKSWNRFGNII